MAVQYMKASLGSFYILIYHLIHKSLFRIPTKNMNCCEIQIENYLDEFKFYSMVLCKFAYLSQNQMLGTLRVS